MFTVEDYEKDVRGWEQLFEEDENLPEEFKLSPEALGRAKYHYVLAIKKLAMAKEKEEKQETQAQAQETTAV